MTDLKHLNFKVLVLCLSAVLLAYFTVHQLAAPAEVALGLACSSLVADGKVPYVDFLDNASPYCYYLALPVILLSRLFFLHPILIANLALVLGFAGSMLLIDKMAEGSFRHRLLRAKLPFLALAAFLFLFVFIGEFGQSPLVYVLFSLPYLCARYMSSSFVPAAPKGPLTFSFTRSIAGIMQGLVIFLDPLFLLAFLATEITVAVSRPRRYFGVELVSAFVTLAVMLAALALMPAAAVSTYCGPICHLNQLSFEFFNDVLFYVEKSPDRRDLIYFYVVSQALILPVVWRCLLTRLLSVLAGFGFGYYVGSTNLLSWQALAMCGYSILGLGLCCSYYFRKFAIPVPLSINAPQKLALPVLTVLLAGGFFYKQVPADKWFRLERYGYHGWGLASDLTFFGGPFQENCPPRKLAAVCATQLRPGFPLIMQLRENGDYFQWGFPFHTLKVMRERKLPDQVADLLAFEDKFYTRLKASWTGPNRPDFIVVEDGEVRDSLWAHGINTILENDYEPGPYLSLLNGDEIAAHPHLEYIGYPLSFASFKLKARTTLPPGQ